MADHLIQINKRRSTILGSRGWVDKVDYNLGLLAGPIGIILLEIENIVIINYLLGLFHKASGLQFNPTFVQPLRVAFLNHRESVKPDFFLQLKDQSSQRQRQQGSDKAKQQLHVPLLCRRLNVYVGWGKDKMPFLLWSLCWSQKQISNNLFHFAPLGNLAL